MVSPGKRIVRDRLDEIQNEVQEYYGLLNELRMGARSSIPAKPEILVLYENLKLFNIPLVSGGYQDQPWLLTRMLLVVKNTVDMMERLQSINDKNKG